MNNGLKIFKTDDGSLSLMNEEMDETYHSSRGARSESMHVYIENGLLEYQARTKSSSINILEIGLGTGLNALLTSQVSKQIGLAIHYHALEPYPLSKDIYFQLNYGVENELLMKIHDGNWSENISLNNLFEFKKEKSTLEKSDLSMTHYDLIYFDAFAPSKQPEVWCIENIKKCFDSLKAGGFLVTYAAQGQFKRNLKKLGFTVEVLTGALGKAQMVRAVKP